MNKYEKLALKIVPTGHDRSRGGLRKDIANALAAEVEAALTEQRDKHFPDLGVMVDAIKRREVELSKNEKAAADKLAQAEKALQLREETTKTREDNLAAFQQAFNAYAAWLDGDGEVDDNGRRFAELRAACKKLQETTR